MTKNKVFGYMEAIEETREFKSGERNGRQAAKLAREAYHYLPEDEVFEKTFYAPYAKKMPKYIERASDNKQRIYGMGFSYGAKEELRFLGIKEENKLKKLCEHPLCNNSFISEDPAEVRCGPCQEAYEFNHEWKEFTGEFPDKKNV